MRVAVLAAMVGLSAACAAQTVQQPVTNEPAWERALEQRHDELVRLNGPGTDAALRTRLLAMGDEDQAARGFAHGAPKNTGKLEIAPNLAEIDARLMAELKQIVAADGWPTIHLVGIEASNDAMLVLIHSADHAWQRSLLPQLEQMAAEGKIDGSQLALVVDKELVAAGKPQRYGTQFKFVDGQAMMIQVEDPEHLDERRAAAMLPPMSAYRQLLTDMYHVKISDMILRPDAPQR